jgi:hypothetical protein
MSDTKRISRRQALQTGITALAGGFAATAALAADDPDAGKMSKAVVQYRYHPAKNGNHCAICANFLPPESCKLVAGKIYPIERRARAPGRERSIR